MTNDNPNGPDPDPHLPALRAELRDLMPFLDDADGLQPEHLRELRARAAELVARIGDDR